MFFFLIAVLVLVVSFLLALRSLVGEKNRFKQEILPEPEEEEDLISAVERVTTIPAASLPQESEKKEELEGEIILPKKS